LICVLCTLRTQISRSTCNFTLYSGEFGSVNKKFHEAQRNNETLNSQMMNMTQQNAALRSQLNQLIEEHAHCQPQMDELINRNKQVGALATFIRVFFCVAP
jgi:uncharacterized protein (DUF3084 family)